MIDWRFLFHHPVEFLKTRTEKYKTRRKNAAEDKRKYNADVEQYIRLNTREEFSFSKEYEYSFKSEWRYPAGGTGSYFWMDLWGAQRIIEHHPSEHYDIGSRIDGFISHMMLFPDIKLHLIDIRPLKENLPGVLFKQADATNLETIPDETIESISALCSLEHFGLGRYGDPVDPEACFKAFKAVQRVVRPGGHIYICVPVANKSRCCFNAHRVFSPISILNEFDQCECDEMTVIDPESNPVLRKIEDPHTFKLNQEVDHLTGLFLLTKKHE